MHSWKQWALVLALLQCLATGQTAWSQTDSTLRIMVPFTPGGGADSAARAVARRLQVELGETVVVENKPGAGGNIAFEQVAKSLPDGKTLVLATNSLVINPLLYPATRFDAVKSFTPVAMLARSPVLLLSTNNVPANTLPELLAYIKARPGKLSYASCGNGSIHQLAGESLKASATLDMQHIPYKGCSAAMTDIAGGQVELGMISITSAASFIEAKRVKAVAITADKVSSPTPNLPTITSAGIANFAFDGWYALMAAAGTPPAIVSKLSTAINKALADEELRKAFASAYLEPSTSSSTELGTFIESEVTRYGRIIKLSNIKGD
jgi:tripartite-type tricarboxylate transporter receptor subunit TctC